MPPCLICMKACVGTHHLTRKLKALGHEPPGALLELCIVGASKAERSGRNITRIAVAHEAG
jgi:hypothetical protein